MLVGCTCQTGERVGGAQFVPLLIQDGEALRKIPLRLPIVALVPCAYPRDAITPIIGAIGGQSDFSAIMLGPIKIGNFLNAVLAFLVIAFVVYIVEVPMNRIMQGTRWQIEVAPPAPTKEESLLAEIRDLL
jgi:large conductance mechanosensitive channel protein